MGISYTYNTESIDFINLVKAFIGHEPTIKELTEFIKNHKI